MKVSVIIPVKNEQKSIGRILDALLSQTRRADEIVITDGGSTDDTRSIIESYAAKGAPVRMIRTPGALPGKGRNLAIANARYDIIAMADAGVTLPHDWLEQLVKDFDSDPGLEVVYGIQGHAARSLFEKCFAIVSIPEGIHVNGVKLHYPYLGSMAIKKHVWERIGGFREDLRATEDILFFRQLKQFGFRSIVSPKAVAYWKPRSTFRETAVLSFKYAECDAYSFIHAQTHFRKLATYALGLFLLFEETRHPVMLAVVVLGFILNVLLTCKKHWKDFLKVLARHPQSLVVIAAVILTVDISSMAGFCAGLVKKSLFMRERRTTYDV
ncbi:MAG: glycosyltransferase [Candidatus Omnitrophica bacterium]|nr:glycosyltransferase [Candidatus Omnitrophota bacterium]